MNLLIKIGLIALISIMVMGCDSEETKNKEVQKKEGKITQSIQQQDLPAKHHQIHAES